MTQDFDPQRVLDWLSGQPAASCYWVAFSGGLDSSVLLRALAAVRAQLPGELRAIHVNHGLQASAAAWQQHCEAVCRALHVPIVSERIHVSSENGTGPEAAARAARYAVFARVMQHGDCLLLAQHQDDQLETVLLQLLRGTGLAGLSGMPEQAPFAAGWLARPLLRHSRASLRAWAERQGFDWIEDPSNADTRYDRNYLRQEILPRLIERWPAAAETVARAARHAAEAVTLLTQQADADLARYAVADGAVLALEALRALPRARAASLIRHWLARLGFPPPSVRKLQQFFTELLPARTDRVPCVAWPGVEVRRYRGYLYAGAPCAEAPEPFCLRPGEYHELGPGLGRVGLIPATQGLRADACPPEGLEVRFRAGGEHCHIAGRAHGRSLKHCLQDLGVLPWMRSRLPMFHRGGELLAVAELFVCEGWQAAPGEAALRLDWAQAPRHLAVTEAND